MKNKKILNLFIDFIGIVVFIVCIISILDKVYEIAFFTKNKRVAFYFWIAMFYYGLASCWFNYLFILTKENFLSRKATRYKTYALFFTFSLFLENLFKF